MLLLRAVVVAGVTIVLVVIGFLFVVVAAVVIWSGLRLYLLLVGTGIVVTVGVVNFFSRIRKNYSCQDGNAKKVLLK